MAELIAPEAARRLVLERTERLPAEAVPLEHALDRVLAAEARAREPVPAFDNSAMDGFALRAGDVASACDEAPVSLPVIDESRAGRPAGRSLAPGAAMRISTGAMVPHGADAIVPVEEASEDAGAIELRRPVERASHLRRSGEDLPAGALAVAERSVIGPAELGVLASVGTASVMCGSRPRVAIFTTGDELLRPDEPLRPGGVRNTNGYALPAQARRAGASAEPAERVPDDRTATVRAIEAALALDVVVVCGGVSVGPHDHVKPALAELGVEEVFWGVALRPGKPTWFGIGPARPGGRPPLVFGLPGNPVSAMVTFHLFVRPALAALAGADPFLPRAPAIIAGAYAKRPGRMHAVRCRLEPDDGRWLATPTKDQGSHVLTSMLGADALALIEVERGDVAAGDEVTVEPLWGR